MKGAIVATRAGASAAQPAWMLPSRLYAVVAAADISRMFCGCCWGGGMAGRAGCGGGGGGAKYSKAVEYAAFHCGGLAEVGAFALIGQTATFARCCLAL